MGILWKQVTTVPRSVPIVHLTQLSTELCLALLRSE